MATQPKTPGVYISEPNSFPPSIVGVDTAVPAFIGYTEKAVHNRKAIPMTPVKIGSMAEYHQLFGGRFAETYYLSATDPDAAGNDRKVGDIVLGGTNYAVVELGKKEFNLYDSLVLFYANGGGDCHIVSCGLYAAASGVARADLLNGLEAMKNIVGPTMLVIPDAALLPVGDAGAVADAMLRQCEAKRDRVAILDVIGGWREKWATDADMQAAVDAYRTSLASIPPTALRYGMAYFPFVMTSVVQPTDVTMVNFDMDDAHTKTLKDALTGQLGKLYPATTGDSVGTPPLSAKGDGIRTKFVNKIDTANAVTDDTVIPAADVDKITYTQLIQGLTSNIPAFTDLLRMIAGSQNMLPPSGAIAGIYTANDTNAGVWNAPANVGLALVDRPASNISDHQQEDMNVPAEGMAINAIRSFVNRGTLVWGARTLDGNSSDWRYIQVRRTMIYVEQSVKTALNRFVFAPNTAQTWVTVTSMIESFLHGVWAAGGLMGTSAQQAYNVQCGLGSTMTPDDILNGNMIVQVVLQMVHPAEFIQLTFKQQMLGGA
jgi:phage tail sheath protein FI